MIKILNSNSINCIEKYFIINSERLYLANSLKEVLKKYPLEIRHLIFNQYLIPVAEIQDSVIKHLVIFDTRYLNKSTQNILIFCGDIQDDFLRKAIKIVNTNFYDLKKITIKFMENEINQDFQQYLKSSRFLEELNIKIGNKAMYQYSLFLN